MNLTEQTVLLALVNNLEEVKEIVSDTFEIESEKKTIVIENVISVINSLCNLPLSESVLPEINEKTGIAL